MVPSGSATRVQPHRWIRLDGGTGRAARSLDKVFPPLALCLVWCTLQRTSGLVEAAGPPAVPVPQHHRVADPRREGIVVPDVRRQAWPAPAGTPSCLLRAGRGRARPSRGGRAKALPMTASPAPPTPGVVSGATETRAGGWSARRSQSSSTHSRTRSSSASRHVAGHDRAPAPRRRRSPRRLPLPARRRLPPGLGRARAAHRARTDEIHSCCSAELPSSRTRSASEMCAHP